MEIAKINDKIQERYPGCVINKIGKYKEGYICTLKDVMNSQPIIGTVVYYHNDIVEPYSVLKDFNGISEALKHGISD